MSNCQQRIPLCELCVSYKRQCDCYSSLLCDSPLGIKYICMCIFAGSDCVCCGVVSVPL